MLIANTAGDYLTDRLLGQAADEDARYELIANKAECMLEHIRAGGSVEGIDLEDVIERSMESSLMINAIKAHYLNDAKDVIALVDWDLECAAYALAEQQLREM